MRKQTKNEEIINPVFITGSSIRGSKEEGLVCLTVLSGIKIYLTVYKRELTAFMPVRGDFRDLKIMFMKQKVRAKSLLNQEPCSIKSLNTDGAILL